jgi:hypothetical protein
MKKVLLMLLFLFAMTGCDKKVSYVDSDKKQVKAQYANEAMRYCLRLADQNARDKCLDTVAKIYKCEIH